MKKVIIIGAGPAGITAGYELLKRSGEYEVVIFEESDAIGGISRTVSYHGNRMDIGGHRFFSKDNRVMQWWEDILPEQGAPAYDDVVLKKQNVPVKQGGPDPEKCDDVMLMRKRISRIYYKKKFFDYPVSMSMNTIRNMGFATTVAAGFSYIGGTVHKKKETSLENFYINRFGRKLYSMFFEGYTEKLWGRHPREISADWGAQRVKGLSITAIIKDIFRKLFHGKKADNKNTETSLIEWFLYPKYGPGQLWETAAERFVEKGGIIKKNCKVVRLVQENGSIKSVIYTDESGAEIEEKGDIVISSMPVKDLIHGMNDVPADIQRIAGGLPYRDFVTVGVLVNKLQLKNETNYKTLSNIVPDCWIYVQDTSVKLGRIQIFNNWSPYLVAKPEETVWVGLEYFCDEGDKFWNMSASEWTKFASDELVKMGILNASSDVLDSHCEKVKKAYPAYFDTYSEMDKLIEYLNTFENLYCVGRNGQHRYNNMDHSMVTAFETVDNIISGRTSKDNIWNVNTEKSYHEEKQA